MISAITPTEHVFLHSSKGAAVHILPSDSHTRLEVVHLVPPPWRDHDQVTLPLHELQRATDQSQIAGVHFRRAAHEHGEGSVLAAGERSLSSEDAIEPFEIL